MCSSDLDNYVDEDGWTVKTIDGKKSAHWEHTIGLANGVLLADGKKIYSAESLKVGLFK